MNRQDKTRIILVAARDNAILAALDPSHDHTPESRAKSISVLAIARAALAAHDADGKLSILTSRK
jgi:hypothetical protein